MSWYYFFSYLYAWLLQAAPFLTFLFCHQIKRVVAWGLTFCLVSFIYEECYNDWTGVYIIRVKATLLFVAALYKSFIGVTPFYKKYGYSL